MSPHRAIGQIIYDSLLGWWSSMVVRRHFDRLAPRLPCPLGRGASKAVRRHLFWGQDLLVGTAELEPTD
jgi:hypothetical protein